MEDVREYFKFYIGQEVIASDPYDNSMTAKGVLTGIHGEYGPEVQFIIDGNALEEPEYPGYDKTKLILRRLDSMTEEEMEDVWHMIEPKNVLTMNYEDGRCRKVALCSERTIYLLSKGFWLFGDEAFDKGLIIDSNTLNKEV